MSDLQDLQKRVEEFVRIRDWDQFHDDPKNILLALASEVGELAEIFRYTDLTEAKARTKSRKADVEDEAADILYNLLLFCSHAGIDLEQAFLNKEKKRELKYPVDKFKGVNAKYDAV